MINKILTKNFDIPQNYEDLEKIIKQYKISKVCHLAAQAGVRYSLEAPMEYIKSNIVGHLNILEIHYLDLCRLLGRLNLPK